MQRNAPASTLDRIIRHSPLAKRLGVDPTTLYRWYTADPPRFPKPIKLGPNSIGWRESDVQEWLETREKVG